MKWFILFLITSWIEFFLSNLSSGIISNGINKSVLYLYVYPYAYTLLEPFVWWHFFFHFQLALQVGIFNYSISPITTARLSFFYWLEWNVVYLEHDFSANSAIYVWMDAHNAIILLHTVNVQLFWVGNAEFSIWKSENSTSTPVSRLFGRYYFIHANRRFHVYHTTMCITRITNEFMRESPMILCENLQWKYSTPIELSWIYMLFFRKYLPNWQHNFLCNEFIKSHEKSCIQTVSTIICRLFVLMQCDSIGVLSRTHQVWYAKHHFVLVNI